MISCVGLWFLCLCFFVYCDGFCGFCTCLCLLFLWDLESSFRVLELWSCFEKPGRVLIIFLPFGYFFLADYVFSEVDFAVS